MSGSGGVASPAPTVAQIPGDARPLDVLVLGSGVAGLSSAVRLAGAGAGGSGSGC